MGKTPPNSPRPASAQLVRGVIICRIISCTLVAGGCRQVANDGGAMAAPRIEDGRGLLFTFFDSSAQMRTVDRLSEIPSAARPAVMVTSLAGQGGGESSLGSSAGGKNSVFVTDLSQKQDNGEYRVWREERGKWIDRVMPRASVARLELPRRRGPPRRRTTGPKRRTRRTPAAAAEPATEPAAAPAPKAKVVMFSTSWCPSCRSARQFLAQNQVPYVELDVERDQTAAQRMLAIQRARGMREGSVPLIVVGNQVFQGFSRMQLAAAIAQL